VAEESGEGGARVLQAVHLVLCSPSVWRIFSERLFDRHGVFGLFSELAGWQLCILPLFKRTYPLFINYYRR
jgi:hypothetical protein